MEETSQSPVELTLEPRSVELSKVESVQVVPSGFEDGKGFTRAGFLLSHIDLVAAFSVHKWLRGLPPYVLPTRSMDQSRFLRPVKTGSILVLEGTVTKSFNTSVEVKVAVFEEDKKTLKRYHCCNAILTFVAISGPRNDLNKVQLPPAVPETPQQMHDFELAELRRQTHLDKPEDELAQMLRVQEYIQHSDEVRTAAGFCEMMHIVMPPHGNPIDSTFGGQVMDWLETCAGVSAGRHVKTWASTIGTDSFQFHHPSHVGDVVIVRSFVTRTFKTSLEVYAAMIRLPRTTSEEVFTNDGFLTLVATDEEGKALPIDDQVTPKNEVEQYLFNTANGRRQKRLKLQGSFDENNFLTQVQSNN